MNKMLKMNPPTQPPPLFNLKGKSQGLDKKIWKKWANVPTPRERFIPMSSLVPVEISEDKQHILNKQFCATARIAYTMHGQQSEEN